MLATNLPNLLFQQMRRVEDRADRIYEAVIGIVVDNKDPEKLARVKVKYPALGGPDSSWWAPLAALGSGEERGWFFLPEINDEVLVMFEHGDIQRPIVIGALWNGKDAPCDKNDGSNERRTIMSRSGSRITFDDAEGTVTVEDGESHGKIVISKDNKITIESPTGDVCFHAPEGELNIVANEISSQASQSYHIIASKGANVGADGTVTVKSMTLQLQCQSTNINPGGTQAPTATQDSCAEVPDPIGS